MPRGGARAGRAGASYGQRTDLNVAKLPAVAAPGQVYGQAGQQIAAQQAMPMAPQPSVTPVAAPEQPPVQPGQFGPMLGPTTRPNEPLTSGAPFGPGPNTLPVPAQGPSAMSWQTTRDAIRGMAAANPASPTLAALAAYAGNGM